MAYPKRLEKLSVNRRQLLQWGLVAGVGCVGSAIAWNRWSQMNALPNRWIAIVFWIQWCGILVRFCPTIAFQVWF